MELANKIAEPRHTQAASLCYKSGAERM